MIKTRLLLHDHFIKLVAIVFGYTIWFFMAQFQNITIKQSIPICFYNQNNLQIIAPEELQITVSGPRQKIYYFDKESSALYLDASKYEIGKHSILLNRDNLFLPDDIKLVHLIPTHLIIEISSNH